MVALVLISIAFAIASRVIMGSFSGFDETSATTGGKAMAMEAAERLAGDVRATRSDGRDGGKLVDVADLRDAIDRNGDLFDIDGTRLDWRDVVRAEGNTLVFQADVVDDGSGASSPECIRWEVSGTSRWHVQRTVRPYSLGCGGSPAAFESDRLTDPISSSLAPTPGTAGTPALFRYVIARPVAGGCRNVLVNGPVSAADRNRIVAVRIAFSSLTTARDAAGTAALGTEISLRSRGSSDYQFAMRCEA